MRWLTKLIQNLNPDHLEFYSEAEFQDFAARRPDLILRKRKGDNPDHVYCTARWSLF